jgi:hypothetical protein
VTKERPSNTLLNFLKVKRKVNLSYYEQKLSGLLELINQQIVKNLYTLREKCDIIFLKLQLKLNVLNTISDFMAFIEYDESIDRAVFNRIKIVTASLTQMKITIEQIKTLQKTLDTHVVALEQVLYFLIPSIKLKGATNA